MKTLLENAVVFDGHSEELSEGVSIAIEKDRIKEVSRSATFASPDVRIDCGGRFLMPGLIDAHFHAYTPTFDILSADQMPAAFLVSHAVRLLEGALQRGFTTVRDAGGADYGLVMALERGLINGPRLFISGKALSQTGGHGDFRARDRIDLCNCGSYSGSLSITADGVDGVRRAAREQLHFGANQLKIFVSGGGISPTDPMHMPQFTDEEILAAVHEAGTRETYVMAHSHTDESARRSAELGVRTIEHGTLINRVSTARLMAEKGVFLVPTCSVVHVLVDHGVELNIPSDKAALIRGIWNDMLASIELCDREGVKIGFGTDLLGAEFHPLQGGEFELRANVQSSLEVLRSATRVNAEILNKSGELGCIAPGAYADIIVLQGNPLEDLSIFRNPDNFALIMKGGVPIKNRLA